MKATSPTAVILGSSSEVLGPPLCSNRDADVDHLRVKDVDEGISRAIQAEHGFGHTACMWSKNIENLRRMARVSTRPFSSKCSGLRGSWTWRRGLHFLHDRFADWRGTDDRALFRRQRRCTLKDFFQIVWGRVVPIPAIALIEFASIARAIRTGDAMVKRSEVRVLRRSLSRQAST